MDESRLPAHAIAGRFSDPKGRIAMEPDRYDLPEDAFGPLADPDDAFPSAAFDGAVSLLRRHVLDRRGAIVLAGAPGIGKTTVLGALARRLRCDGCLTFSTPLPGQSFDGLIDQMSREAGVAAAGPSGMELIGRLRAALEARSMAGSTALLPIDDGANLSPELVRHLPLLADLRGDGGGDRGRDPPWLVQTILAGPADLVARWIGAGLQSWRETPMVLRLGALEPDEIGPYLAHRLARAGLRLESAFTPQAIRTLAEATRGIPRSIDLICRTALRLARAESLGVVPSGLIEQAVQECAPQLAPRPDHPVSGPTHPGRPGDTGADTPRTIEVVARAVPRVAAAARPARAPATMPIPHPPPAARKGGLIRRTRPSRAAIPPAAPGIPPEAGIEPAVHPRLVQLVPAGFEPEHRAPLEVRPARAGAAGPAFVRRAGSPEPPPPRRRAIRSVGLPVAGLAGLVAAALILQNIVLPQAAEWAAQLGSARPETAAANAGETPVPNPIRPPEGAASSAETAPVSDPPGADPAAVQDAAPPPPASSETERLAARGDELIAAGDLVSGRLFHQLAAARGHARSALAIGKTYDPLYLAEAGLQTAVADPVRALDWYRRAAEAGDAQAPARLIALTAWLDRHR